MVTVAARDNFAGQLMVLAVALEAYPWRRALEIVQADIFTFIQKLVIGLRMRIVQIFGDLGLTVDRNDAAGEALEINSRSAPGKRELHPIVNQAFPVHARAYAGLIEHIDRALLQHARANATFYIRLSLALEDDKADAGELQQTPEEQTGRTRADDRHLGLRIRHLKISSRLRPAA